MKKKVWIIFKIIILSVLPTLLSFLGRSHIDLSFLQKAVPVFADMDQLVVKDYFILAGMIITIIVIDIQYALSEFDRKTVTRQREFLIQYIKNIFIESLESKLQEENTCINVRLFVPKKGILFLGKKILEKLLVNRIKLRKAFVVKNMDCLSEPGFTNGLCFQVEPQAQGLVGLCYKERCFVYCEDLRSIEKDLNLTIFQRNKLANIVFWLCVPVINRNNEVIAVISFDSKNKINISKIEHDELSRAVTNFSQFFGEGLPDLLK